MGFAIVSGDLITWMQTGDDAPEVLESQRLIQVPDRFVLEKIGKPRGGIVDVKSQSIPISLNPRLRSDISVVGSSKAKKVEINKFKIKLAELESVGWQPGANLKSFLAELYTVTKNLDANTSLAIASATQTALMTESFASLVGVLSSSIATMDAASKKSLTDLIVSNKIPIKIEGNKVSFNSISAQKTQQSASVQED